MNLSGILVTATASELDAVLARLAALPGLEVHGVDHSNGRVVVVQEAEDVAAEVQAFSRIRTLPHVLGADLVCHYFGDAGAPASDL